MPFTRSEIEILQRVMDRAFGQAAEELGDVAGMSIDLHATTAKVVEAPHRPEFLASLIPDIGERTVVEQQFRGQSDGDALLIFPADTAKILGDLLAPGEDELENEALMEIGNILIGACTGRLFEMLGRTIYYLPPRIFSGGDIGVLTTEGRYTPEDFALMVNAQFGFENERVFGDMLLVNRRQSIGDLKLAIAEYHD